MGSTRTIRSACDRGRDQSATRQMVEEQKFRSDLYYRLQRVSHHRPPLRERRRYPRAGPPFRPEVCRRMKETPSRPFPSETMGRCRTMPWPGNVRELEELVERAVILSSKLGPIVPIAELKGPIDTERAGAHARRRGARAHTQSPARRAVDHRWSGRRRCQAWHEADHPAIQDAKARNHTSFLIRPQRPSVF